MGFLTSELEDNIQDYLLYEGQKRTKNAEQRKAEKIAKIKAKSAAKVAKKQIKIYKKAWYSDYVKYIANLKFLAWVDEGKARKDEKLKKDAAALQTKIDEIWWDYTFDSNNFLYITCDLMQQVDKYNELVKPVFPDKTVFYPDVEIAIYTQADNKFADLKAKAQKDAKKLQDSRIRAIKKAIALWNKQYDIQSVQRQLAQIPLSIEDKMQEIKDVLDELLGRKLDKLIDPDSPDFDLDVLLERIQALIDPLLASVGPIESVGGSIPILGDLAGMFSMMSQSSANRKLTKEQIKKLLPGKPALPDKQIGVVKGIFDDVLAVAMTMPMILINVIFKMIEVITGLLKQLGLPLPFPLNLIPNVFTIFPLMWKFMTKVPVLVYAAAKGLLVDKLSEAMALSIQPPNIDLSAIMEPDPELPTIKSKPDTKNIEFKDVINDKLSAVSKYGYSMSDLQKILKSYGQIYDGSKGTINNYTGFNGTSDVLSSFTPIKQTITRTQGSPEDFKTKLDQIFSGPNISAEVTYDKIKKTSSVVGEKYYKYKKGIEAVEPNKQVVFKDKIEP